MHTEYAEGKYPEPSDMVAITALDRGERTGPNPDEFDYIPD